MTMTVSKSYTETSTLLPKSTNAVEEERPNWATIVSRGHQYLFPPPPSDDLISNAFAKYHEVTQMTKDLSYPRDEIKSQLVSSASQYQRYSISDRFRLRLFIAVFPMSRWHSTSTLNTCLNGSHSRFHMMHLSNYLTTLHSSTSSPKTRVPPICRRTAEPTV